MLANESRNSRLNISRGASRSSYNSKDPPEFGSRGSPDSREAPSSFSNYLECFYPKALSDYLSRRETLKRELSFFHAAHPRVMEKARLEPNSVEQCRVLQTQHDELVSAYEIELSSQKRELYSRYERKYLDFRCKESARTQDKLQSMKETITRWMELRERVKLVSPSIDARAHSASSSCSPNPKEWMPLSPEHAPSPALVSNTSVPPLSNPGERVHPRTPLVVITRVSNPETQNTPERVPLARPKVNLSSAEPDPVPAPRGLNMSPPRVACGLPPARKSVPMKGFRPFTSVSETASSDDVSRLSPRHSMRVKLLEQSNKTVPSREPPKGSSLMGIKPSSRIVSAPAPKRVNAHTPGKTPIRKMDVNVEKDTSARRHSLSPNAALTLRNSVAVLSIRPSLARSCKARSELSSPVSSKPNPSIVVNARQVVSEATHHKIETRPRVSSVSISKVPPASPSSRFIPTLPRMPNGVKICQGVNETTRHSVKAHTRASLKPIIPRFGKSLSADDIERSDEHSKVIIGPAVAQALNFFSSEVGEGRRVPDSVVSIQNGAKENGHSPNPLTAFTLPASVPVSLSVPPARVGSHPQRPEDPIPSIEAISGRHNLSVVNKTSLASVAHSPMLEATRRWSRSSSTPARDEGGGQLASAAAYIRERSSRRSSAYDEFGCRTPKVPPDKTTEPVMLRHELDVVSENEKASISRRSPEFTEESLNVVLSYSQSEAAPLQPHGEVWTPPLQPETPRANELSAEFPESLQMLTGPKRDMSDDGVQEERATLSVEVDVAVRCLDEHLDEIPEISEEPVVPALADVDLSLRGSARQQPAHRAVSETKTRAHLCSPVPSVALTPLALSSASLLQAHPIDKPSLELDRSALKSPYNGSFQWRSRDAVSLSFTTPNAGRRSLEYEMGSSPISKPNYTLADAASYPSSLELVWWERIKPPDTAAHGRSLYESCQYLEQANRLCYVPGRPLTPLNVTPPLSLMFFVSAALALRCSLRMPCGVHLLIAVLGQRI